MGIERADEAGVEAREDAHGGNGIVHAAMSRKLLANVN
jgi:hypothetical protein